MFINEYVTMKLHEQDIRKIENKNTNSTFRTLNEIISDFKNSNRRTRKSTRN